MTLVAATACAEEPVDGLPTWNQWRGPQRDGSVTGPLPTRLGDNVRLLWQKDLSPSYSGPIVSGRLVYTTETIDKTDEAVTAYDLESGDQVWQAKWPGSMAVPFFAGVNGDWIRATPACNGDALVVLGMRDVLVCLDAKTGGERWRTDFPKTLNTKLPIFGGVCSPLIDGDAVYVQTGGPTVKISLGDGSVLWQTLPSGNSPNNSGSFSSPTIATIDGHRQLLVQTREELCGVDLASGDVWWREPIESYRGMNILTPTVVGDRIFTTAHSGRSEMWQIKRGDDKQWTVKQKWEQKSQGYMSAPIVIDDQIYLHAKNERLIALDANDGTLRWTGKPLAKYLSMVHSGDQVLALSNTGQLRLIAHDTAQPKIVDTMEVADDSWAYLAIAGNKIIVRDLKSLKVFVFKL